MNYEKKYKEALERARKLKENPQSVFNEYSPKEGDTICDHIFPELKESEDERIREYLIRYIDNTMKSSELKSKLLSWLEKQDTKKHEEELEKAYKTADKVQYRRGYEAAMKEMEKQGEQKPQRIISAEAKEAMYNKPAWSEEDEEYINDLIGVFDGQQYQAHSDEEIVKWLKSIRLPYNKEWDENDEEMLRSIIATCELAEQDRDSSPARHLLEMQLNWLKTLKQRNTWKPSDEQMKQLGWIAEQNKDNMIGKELISLYQDLKKLREE